MPESVTRTIKIGLKPGSGDSKDDDIWYVLIGEADVSSVAVVFLYVFVMGFLLVAGIFSYAFISGGMQWILVLFILTIIAVLFVLFIRRGIRIRKAKTKSKPPQEVFTGELVELTETLGRAKGGFSYSQQLVRERIAEAIVDKVRAGGNLDRDEVLILLKEGDTSFIGNEHLARFLLENKRELSKWDKRAKKKSGSKERGRRFMTEIDNVMKETEAML